MCRILGRRVNRGCEPFGNSRANLVNSSTRPKLPVFGEYSLLPKWTFSEICETRQTRQHWPSIFGKTCQTRPHSPNLFARTCQNRKRRVWQVLRIFGVFCKFSECRLDCFIQKICNLCKNSLSYNVPSTFARTRQTGRHLPNAIFEKM